MSVVSDQNIEQTNRGGAGQVVKRVEGKGVDCSLNFIDILGVVMGRSNACLRLTNMER